jgi:hypothetical protein
MGIEVVSGSVACGVCPRWGTCGEKDIADEPSHKRDGIERLATAAIADHPPMAPGLKVRFNRQLKVRLSAVFRHSALHHWRPRS